jgi:hypothetical protein
MNGLGADFARCEHLFRDDVITEIGHVIGAKRRLSAPQVIQLSESSFPFA